MKVTKIVHLDGLYYVTLWPNWLERIFGCRLKIVKLRKNFGAYYTYGGQSIYTYENGEQTPNNDYIAKAIDKFNRSF